MPFHPSFLLKPWNSAEGIFSNLHFIFACLAVLTLPIDVDVQYCSIATVLLLINWVASGNYKSKWDMLIRQKLGLLIIFFYLLHVVGLLYSIDLKYGTSIVERMLSLLVLPIILISWPPNPHQRDFIVISFVFFCVFLSSVGLLYGWLHYEEVIAAKGPEHLVTYIANMHRVYFSLYLLFCYWALCYYFLKLGWGHNPVWKWVCLLLALFIVASLFVMASRIVLILLIISTAIIIFYFTIIKRKQYMLAFILSLIGVVVLVTVYTQVTYIRNFMDQLTHKLDQGQSTEVNSVNIRVVKYKCALEGIREHWLFGVGTGDVQSTLNGIYKKNEFHLGYQVNMDAHNQYLQTWLGLGLPGLFLLVALFVLNVWKGIRTRNYLLASFMLLFGIACITESMLTTQKGIVFLSLFYPLLYANYYLKNQNQHDKEPDEQG